MLNLLPAEVLIEIFKHLSFLDLARVHQTDCYFARVLESSANLSRDARRGLKLLPFVAPPRH